MTKLIIQIPAFNEEGTLGIAMADLPKTLKGIDELEWLIINDGSTDRTVEEAKKHGAHHVVSHIKNQGLARTFMTGLDACLKAGADIIVNTDADNQYCAADIQKLIQPILDHKADIVIGERPISSIAHFSRLKKYLQKLGSWVIRLGSGTTIPDAPSGFRAISRKAALQINVFSQYTYTLEMIIQAGKQGFAITSVPIRVNGDLRPSRLMKSVGMYIMKSMITLMRIRNTYEPLKFFITLGSIPFLLGFFLCLRWVIFFMGEQPATHIPSLIVATFLILLGVQLWIFGLIADLISVNRKILEDVQVKVRDKYYIPDTKKP